MSKRILRVRVAGVWLCDNLECGAPLEEPLTGVALGLERDGVTEYQSRYVLCQACREMVTTDGDLEIRVEPDAPPSPGA
jgi:hypothetical protein